MNHVLLVEIKAHDFMHVGQNKHVLVLVELPELAGGVSHLDEGGVASNAEGLLEELFVHAELVLAVLIGT